jgi:meso-butanediol dehydrogenase / (S,S)-butanediol dehydrogenase / diacetyl reductase
MRLDGKVALVTGGGAGIGAAIAGRFVAEGARVCITGRRQRMLDEVACGLPAGAVATCSGDVTEIEDARRMVDAALAFNDRLDILVNNAAIDPAGTIVDIDPALWRRVMETNITGPFLMMKAAIPHMIDDGGGSIINIASLAGLRCLPGMPAYCTSKAGLIMLTQQAALDYGPAKIRCNAVCPGATRTEMLEHSLGPAAAAFGTDVDGIFKRISANVPLRRVALPAEIGGLCTFLAEDDSAFMTGAVLVFDGGAAIVDVAGTALSDSGVKWGVGGP